MLPNSNEAAPRGGLFFAKKPPMPLAGSSISSWLFGQFYLFFSAFFKLVIIFVGQLQMLKLFKFIDYEIFIQKIKRVEPSSAEFSP